MGKNVNELTEDFSEHLMHVAESVEKEAYNYLHPRFSTGLEQSVRTGYVK